MATIRMNISVPADLRRRMEAIPENWSETASEAFKNIVAWRESAVIAPDPLVIVGTLVKLMNHAELPRR